MGTLRNHWVVSARMHYLDSKSGRLPSPTLLVIALMSKRETLFFAFRDNDTFDVILNLERSPEKKFLSNNQSLSKQVPLIQSYLIIFPLNLSSSSKRVKSRSSRTLMYL